MRRPLDGDGINLCCQSTHDKYWMISLLPASVEVCEETGVISDVAKAKTPNMLAASVDVTEADYYRLERE